MNQARAPSPGAHPWAAGRHLAWLALLLPLACQRGPGCSPRTGPDGLAACALDRPALVEVRDGRGALQLALRPPLAGGSADLVCDAEGHLTGSLERAAGGLALKDGSGAVVARLEQAGGAAPGEDDPMLHCSKGAVRLRGSGALVRLLDAAGVPLGQLEAQPGKAIAFDAAGRGVATAERVEKDDASRLAVRTPDGTTRFILVGPRRERAAAAFALDALRLEERLLLSRFYDTP